MNDKIKITGKLRTIGTTALLMGALIAVIDVYLYSENVRCGIAVTAFLLFYMFVAGYVVIHGSRSIMFELVSFATQYGQIQKQLLRTLDIPYALLDDNGKVIWTNAEFEKAISKEKHFNKSITALFPTITKDKLPGHDLELNENEIEVEYDANTYLCRLKKISLVEMAQNCNLIETEEDYSGYLIAMYLFDNTALKIALREVDDQSLAVGLVYLDNYDEAMEAVEEVRRSLLTALIERKINKYMSTLDGITKKIEKDKYMVILRKSAITQLRENKFDLLEEVKSLNIGNDMPVTLSIGVGPAVSRKIYHGEILAFIYCVDMCRLNEGFCLYDYG